MSVRNTKGLKIYLEKDNATPIIKDGSDGGTTLTGIADNSGDTDLTVDAVTGVAAGDTVKLENTGFTELDGKTFVIKSATGTTITIPVDISTSTGAFDAAKAKATILPMGQLQGICANSISVDANTPGTVSIATFCDPTASIPSIVNEPGNLTLSVFHDVTDAGFKLLESAAAIGDERTLVIEFPSNGGHMIATGTMSAFSISDVPLDGAAQWQATFALSSKPELRY